MLFAKLLPDKVASLGSFAQIRRKPRSSRRLRSRRHRISTWDNGGLEQLEARRLLSATSWELTEVSPEWFAEVDYESADGMVHVESVAATNSEANAESWVVQFAMDALDGVESVADAAELLPGSGDVEFELVRGLGFPGQVLVRTQAAPQNARDWLAANPNIQSFELDQPIQMERLPNDPYFSYLDSLHNTGQRHGTVDADIDAPEAWDLSTGSAATVVAVIDSGIDYNHPDLMANLWTNSGEVYGNGIDDDGNGFVDDRYGWDFANNDPLPYDDNDHGTHVAGTIAAAGDNGLGVTGVSWHATIMPLKFSNAKGEGWTSDAVGALNYATMMKTKYGVNIVVANISWGGGRYSESLRNALAASGRVGILSVAAAGNHSLNIDTAPHYPASYHLETMITVAATDRSDKLAEFSNYGARSVDIAAPGDTILSTLPRRSGGYGWMSGTSMAAPHVAGVAALAFSMDPTATVQEVRSAILRGGDYLSALYGRVSTASRLNALRTLQLMSEASNRDEERRTASVNVSDITTGGDSSYTFTATYRDDVAIDVSDLDGRDVVVYRSSEWASFAEFVQVDHASDGTPRTATYRINAPGGTWDAADNGSYSVLMYAGVTDTSENNIGIDTLGAFEVRIDTIGDGPRVYEGVSPVTAMIPYKGGVLTAFSNVAGNPSLYRVHWSPDGDDLGGQTQHIGEIRYEGISPVTAMIPYRGGVLTAFSNVAGNPNLYRIHWSPDGSNLGGGEIRYEGISPVTAMIPYQDGVLTAFSNVAGNPNLYRVHWSPDGNNLGGGEVRYEGISPVTAMIPYNGGVLTAFSNVAGNPNLHRIHWSPDGEDLGGQAQHFGKIRYEGSSPVTAMIPCNGGVLAAFSNVADNPTLHRIHWSPDGEDLGGQAQHFGRIRYEGSSPVTAMMGFENDVLTAFSNVAGDSPRSAIHRDTFGQSIPASQAPLTIAEAVALASGPLSDDVHGDDQVIVEITTFGSSRQNPSNPLDVNGDTLVSPIDVLLVINQINAGNDYGGDPAIESTPIYYDVNGDNSVTPLDVLSVISELNCEAAGEGEQRPLIGETPEHVAETAAPVDLTTGTQVLHSSVENPPLVEGRRVDEPTDVQWPSRALHDAFSESRDWRLESAETEDVLAEIVPSIAGVL